jgi:CubicO group peptidase (beta-lactamase class C family)
MSDLESLDEVPGLLEDRDVPGLSLAFITGPGAVPVTGTWGSASAGSSRPVIPETIFRAGSLSKPTTAFAALGLAGLGRLDLDADVNSLLKSWRVPPVGGWQPVITTRMLLAHVAGTSGWEGEGEGYADAEPPESVIDVLEGRGDAPALSFYTLPNVMWNYSSGGYLVIQLLISELTGLAFPEAMAELVFGPLGMSSATFRTPLTGRFRSLAADAHPQGKIPVPAGLRHDPAMAAAGMWTTPRDLMTLAAAINAGAAPEMLTGHPVEARMGLGLFLNADSGITWWSHDGSVAGFECILAGVAETGFAVAAMTNAAGGAAAAREVASLVSRLHGPGPLGLRHLTWEGIGAAVRMNNYHLSALGTYRLPGGQLVALTASEPDRWGQRRTQITLPGQPRVELAWPCTDGHWRVPGLEALVVFEPPDDLVFHQNGRPVRAKRIA